jgi:ribosomal protein S12 methylthiotransferase accessory factor
MELEIVLPGGDRVDARAAGRVIATDQDGPAPSPFELFLASIGTCAGSYVSRFCRKRNIPTEGIRILQHMRLGTDGKHIERIELEVELPPDFPARYRQAVIRAADQCTVKDHLERPPVIEIALSPAA